LETGYSFDFGMVNAHVTPFVAVQPMHVWQGAASEKFAAIGPGLHFNAASIPALPSYLGVQFDDTWQGKDNQSVVSSLRVAWMHDFQRAAPSAAALPICPVCR